MIVFVFGMNINIEHDVDRTTAVSGDSKAPRFKFTG